MFTSMNYTIEYYNEEVRIEVDQLPLSMRARYQHLVERMKVYGSNLGEPHTSAFGDGLLSFGLKVAMASLAFLLHRREAHRHAAQLYKEDAENPCS